MKHVTHPFSLDLTANKLQTLHFLPLGGQVESRLCKDDIAKSGVGEQREIRNVNQFTSGIC